MYQLLQVISVILVAMGMGLALAHALELPGKLRLQKDAYFTVQSIYHPGFTVGGMFGEAGAMLATLALAIATPSSSSVFPYIVLALIALMAMHAIFWIVTQPVNRTWLKYRELNVAGNGFFDMEPVEPAIAGRDWTDLRGRWEYSHAARAVCGLAALTFLTLGLAR